mmetsp:Transcript_101508/g.291301  ORF Transcript_101508/g.291301 Transcript_101508/m.291301 type:complete len:233 (-) Transcript_101508:601-1299(-)
MVLRWPPGEKDPSSSGAPPSWQCPPTGSRRRPSGANPIWGPTCGAAFEDDRTSRQIWHDAVPGSTEALKSHSSVSAGSIPTELLKKLWITGPRLSTQSPEPILKTNTSGSAPSGGMPAHFSSNLPRPLAVRKHCPCLCRCTILAMTCTLKGTLTPPIWIWNNSEITCLSLLSHLLPAILKANRKGDGTLLDCSNDEHASQAPGGSANRAEEAIPEGTKPASECSNASMRGWC